MDKRRHKHLHLYLILLIAVNMGFNVYFTIKRPVWNERDEQQHYDYIEYLSEGIVPKPTMLVADETFTMTKKDFPTSLPKGFKGTKKSMGLAGRSYEAQQPPLYYLLLAGPNWLLKKMSLSAKGRVLFLRIFQLQFAHLGFLLMIPLFYTFRDEPLFHVTYGYLLVLFMLFTEIKYTCTLGNDSLSVLMGSALLYAYALFFRRRSMKYFVTASIIVTFAFFVKYSNILLLVMHGMAVWLMYHRVQEREKPSVRLWALFPLVVIAFYSLVNRLLFPDYFLPVTVVKQFSTFVHPISDPLSFLAHLATDAFNLKSLGFQVPIILAGIVCIMIFTNMVVGLMKLRNQPSTRHCILFISAVTSFALLTGALILNRVQPGVHWSVFRHYYGALGAWWISITTLPFSIRRKDTRVIVLLLTLVGTLLTLRYAWRVAQW